jgi:hypothetical protein
MRPRPGNRHLLFRIAHQFCYAHAQRIWVVVQGCNYRFPFARGAVLAQLEFALQPGDLNCKADYSLYHLLHIFTRQLEWPRFFKLSLVRLYQGLQEVVEGSFLFDQARQAVGMNGGVVPGRHTQFDFIFDDYDRMYAIKLGLHVLCRAQTSFKGGDTVRDALIVDVRNRSSVVESGKANLHAVTSC